MYLNDDCTSAASLQAAEAVAHAGASDARAALIDETVAMMAHEVAVGAYAERAAATAEAEADVHLRSDLGGANALALAQVTTADNKCLYCI